MVNVMARIELAAALAQVKPFSLVSKAELDRLVSFCTERRIKAGHVIYSEDQWLDYLWVVTEGLVRVTIDPPFGGQATAGVFRPGELVGCLNSVCRHRHTTEGTALTDTALIVVPKRQYQELLANKDFARNVIHIQGERLWDSQTMRAVATLPSEKRLAWTILWLFGKLGRSIPLTRRMLADTAGVARETSIRVLSPLEKKGWLKTRRGVIELLRPERFKEILEAR